jgi:broad specificity phosphatase PhoE
MGNLYLVRHGQASFGAADYDNLSELGHRQSVRLGEHFRHKGVQFDAVLCGTLRRHVQTWEGIRKGAALAMEPLAWPGLNEFDGDALIATINPHPMDRPDTLDGAKHHFRLLRDGLTQWMNGVVSPKGMATYPEFVKGVTSALDHVRQHHTGNVLIVSSGGPISTAVGHILGTTPETTIGLNLRIRNSSVTEFAYTPKHHNLVTFNTLPHLESAEHADWATYA